MTARLGSALAALLLAAGCSSSTSPSSDPRLRIVNNGPGSPTALTVLFPDSEVDFGPVPAGATTSYQRAARGVSAGRARSSG